MLVPGAPGPENLRAGLTESGSMFRHFTMLRYYTFAIFGVSTAALAGLVFKDLAVAQRWERGWTCVSGLVVTIVCGLFERRIGQVMWYYDERLRWFGAELGIGEFGAVPGTGAWARRLDWTAAAPFAAAVIGWIVALKSQLCP